MLYTRYNKSGIKMNVDRSGLAAVEKAGFTFKKFPGTEDVTPEVVEVVVEIVEPVVEVVETVAPVVEVIEEEKPAPKKRGRKPKAPVQVEADKDIVLE